MRAFIGKIKFIVFNYLCSCGQRSAPKPRTSQAPEPLWASFCKLNNMKKLILLFWLLMISIFTFAQWIQQPTPTNYNLYSIFFTDANTGYAVGDVGTILKTTNGGLNWYSLTAGPNNPLNSIYFPDADTGYIVGSNDVVLKTPNGGSTWFVNSTGTGNLLNSVYFTSNNTGYTVGTNGIISKTINGGMNWTTLQGGITNNFRSVCFPDSNCGYVVGRKRIGKDLQTIF